MSEQTREKTRTREKTGEKKKRKRQSDSDGYSTATLIGAKGSPRELPVSKELAGKVCKGCGGGCQTCSGEVIPAKGAGRPKLFCCLNCKARYTNKVYYRRHYQQDTTDGRRRNEVTDFKRLIDGHKRQGHDGEPCPNPIVGSRASCPTLCTLYDDYRESQGLNRIAEILRVSAPD